MQQRCKYILLLAVLAIHSAALAQVAPSLRPYVTCHFSDGLAIVEKNPTPQVTSRTAQTLHGPKEVALTRGERMVLSYPEKSPFIRATIEQLPAATFEQGKSDLVSAFDEVLASDNNVQRNYELKSTLNGYEAHGLDRTVMGGVVLGIYLLIDNANHTVISLDFLNQPPAERSFNSVAEYAAQRDSFLASYTSCIRANLRAAAAAPATSPKKASAPAKKRAK